MAVALDRSVEAVTAMLGTLMAGAAYLPLEPSLPPERLRFVLADAGVEVVFGGFGCGGVGGCGGWGVAGGVGG